MTKQEVEDALKHVVDPEIGLDIVTLGLIYNIDIREGMVNICLTLTSPMCPFGPMIMEQIRLEVGKVEGVKIVELELTFDPPWVPPPEVRLMMGV